MMKEKASQNDQHTQHCKDDTTHKNDKNGCEDAERFGRRQLTVRAFRKSASSYLDLEYHQHDVGII